MANELSREEAERLMREILTVPGYLQHWIPEHLNAQLRHGADLLQRVMNVKVADARVEEAKWWKAGRLHSCDEDDRRITRLQKEVEDARKT